MKTQTIVLALALVAVTPAVLAAQDYVGGPGSKMSYITDNALARIRQNHHVNNQQTQEPQRQEPQAQTQQPQQQQPRQTTTPTRTEPVNAYNYPGPEGKAMLAGELFWQRISERRQQRRARKQANNRHSQSNNNVPTYIRDANSIANNHQVATNESNVERSERQRNSNFNQTVREIGQLIGESLIREAPYMK